MKIQLKRPLVFLDLETTGLNVATDRIVEICVLKLNLDGTQDIKTRRLNPTIPISPQAQAIHGISNEDVAHEPTFKEIAKSLAQWMEGCDIAGYNSTKFDVPMLAEEFLRAGVEYDFRKRKLIDVQNIFHKMEQRTLKAAYKFYCDKELEDAHSAEADTIATKEVLECQLERYRTTCKTTSPFGRIFHPRNFWTTPAELPSTTTTCLSSTLENTEKPVAEILKTEPSYYDWMMRGDFTLDTKGIDEIKLQIGTTP